MAFRETPKAVATDLDGTLLDSQTRLSQRSRQALEDCIEHGIPIIIATSRPARILNRIFPSELAERVSFVIMNGAIARGNPPLSGYFKETLSEEIVRKIVDIALNYDSRIRITLELDGYEFGANWTAGAATLRETNSATPDMLHSLDEAILMNPCKIALGGLEMDILKLSETLRGDFADSVSVVPALLGYPLLNITARGVSKPSALRKLLTPKGISLTEVIAFGDDLPDIDMLKECGASVAVANAFPEVKAVCRYLTASNDEDGVAIVLQEIIRCLEVGG